MSWLVELVDLYPSLAELCGLPVPDDLEGISFAPLLRQPERPWKQAAFAIVTRGGHGTGRSLRTERHHFVRWPDGSLELYDHEHDPDERRNLATEDSQTGLISQLQRILEAGPAGVREELRRRSADVTAAAAIQE